MKNKYLILVLWLLIVSCYQTVDLPKVPDTSQLTNWLISQSPQSKISLLRQLTMDEHIDWSNVSQVAPNLIQVPLIMKGAFSVAASMIEVNNSDASAKAQTLNRCLLFYKQSYGYTVTEVLIVPSEMYLKSHPTGLKDASYNNLPADFDGMVLFYSYKNSKLKGGTLYKNGVKHGVIPIVDLNQANERVQGAVCIEYSVPYYICAGGQCVYKGTDYYTFCVISSENNSYDQSVVSGENQEVGGSGGGGNASGWGEYPFPELELPGVDKISADVDALMRCFSENTTNASYKLTLFVEEPAPGQDAQKVGGNVGHTFVGFTKTVNGREITQFVGFYPVQKSLTYPIDSKIVSNEQTFWTIRVDFEIDAHEFNDAIYAARINSGKSYDISGYNCTSYAMDIFDAAGISLPKNKSEFPYGYGSGYSPGKLGSDIRNLGQFSGGTINLNGGKTSNGNGPCQ